MRFQGLALLLFCSSLGNAFSIEGAYHQTHSNMYVQYTTEIDWKCVKVHANVDNDTTLSLQKQARLHGGPVTVMTPIQTAVLGPNKSNFTVETPHSSRFPRQTYDLHWYTNDTVVVTGEETPALFVWQRANTTEEPVDIARLETFLAEIPFDVPDPIYRKIASTYDRSTC